MGCRLSRTVSNVPSRLGEGKADGLFYWVRTGPVQPFMAGKLVRGGREFVGQVLSLS